MKKRVLAVLLCLLCAMLLLVACGDNNTDTDNQGNNTNNQGHVHTYKTNEEWTKDAQGHWYDATCECEDAPITKLNHTDANNDGACDVCAFTNHEHEYTEDWTADCTNHWNAADCGHTVVGINIGAHVDEDADGRCDVCNYIIEDLHEHYYSSEWSNDGEYHWHAALCEHKVEVADKAAHVINDAGICTECNAKVKEIDKTNILAILAAAVASNNKVVTGDVKLEEIVYDGSESAGTLEVLNSAVTGAYFVLGDGQSYYFMKNYNKDGVLIGGEQQWFESLASGDIFGVKLDVNSYELQSIMGDPAKLSGYTYHPGTMLAANYDDTNTLAQTLYNFYDLMSKGVNVYGATENYDAETGTYSFSFSYFTVNELTSGGEVYDIQLALYEATVEFTVDDNFVINLANFEVKVYNYYDGGKAENDLTYDKETNTITKTPSANPSYYKYQVHQTSGERTFTSPYPKASLVPIGFDFYYVTEHEFPSAAEWVIHAEELIGDTLTVESGVYAYFHLGNPVPSTTNFNFIDTSDFTFTFVNNDPNSDHRAWYMDPGSVDEFLNGYSAFNNCLKLKIRDAGEYTVTIGFGSLTKTFTLVVTAEPEIEVSYNEENNKITVALTDFNTYENDDQALTFTAAEEGNYTFTVPAGLGVRLDGEDYPKIDFLEDNGGTFTVGLNAGESVKIYFAAYAYEVFYVDVAYAYADIPDPVLPDPDEPGEGGEIDIIGTYVGGDLTVVIDEEKVSFTKKGSTLTATYEIKDGAVILYNATYGTVWNSGILAVNLTDGKVTSVVYNGGSVNVTKENAGGDDSGDDEEDNSKYQTVIVIGENKLYFSADEITADAATRKVTITVAGDYSFSSGSLFVKNITDADGNVYAKNADYTITLQPGEYFANFSMLSMFGVKADTEQILNLENKTPAGGDEGDDEEPEVDELKESLHLFMPNNGTYDFMFLTSDGAYLVNIYTSEFDMYFTYELEDNGDGSYTMTVTYADLEDLSYNEEYIAIVEASAFVLFYDGSEWAMEGQGSGDSGDDYEADPLKEAVLGIYTLGDYYASVYYFDGYYVNVYDDAWTVDLYFTFDVIDNEDGTYKLVLTHDARDYELGSDKVASLLALDFIVTPESEEEEGDKSPIDLLNGTYVDNALNGFNVGFYYDEDAWVYYLNVYGGTQDLYYIAIPTENVDGSVTLALTLCEDHSMYFGAPVTDEYDLSGKTVIATPNGDSWAFTLEGQAPVVTPTGTFDNPFTLEENNTCEFPGGWNYIFYSYTPAANGTITITVTSNDFYWGYGYGEYALDNVGTVATATIDVTAGKTLYIGMSTDSAAAASIEFTATFVEGEAGEPEAPATEDGSESNPFTLVMGENSLVYQGYAYAWALYKYTATEDGVLTITMTSTKFDLGYGSSPMMINGSQNSPLAINLTAGQTIWVGITTASGSESDTPITFTASFGNGEGDDVVEDAREVDLVLGNNNVNAENITFVYTADNAVKLEIAVGNYVMNNVDVTYSVNGGTAIAIAQASSVKVDLNQGDVLKIFATTKGGYVTISASEVVIPTIEMDGTGAENDPYIIPSIPYEFSFNGAHDVYVQFTAEKAGTYILTYAQGCYVTGMPSSAVKDSTNCTYTFDMEAGATLMFNPWKTSGSDVYTYSIKMVEKEEEPSDTMTGTGTSSDPYVLPSIPYEFTFTGIHDVYVQFTATEAGTYILTYATGSYITGMPSAAVKDSVNCTYTFTMAAGETLKINPWRTSGSDVYTYTIKLASTPEPEQPGEGGGDEGGDEGGTSSAVTYYGSNGSRGMRVIIDIAADTLTITRAASGYIDNFEIGSPTTYNLVYSEVLAMATNGVTGSIAGTNIGSITFAADGTIEVVAWMGSNYTNFVKQ